MGEGKGGGIRKEKLRTKMAQRESAERETGWEKEKDRKEENSTAFNAAWMTVGAWCGGTCGQ
jgi:hypothetical protein